MFSSITSTVLESTQKDSFILWVCFYSCSLMDDESVHQSSSIKFDVTGLFDEIDSFHLLHLIFGHLFVWGFLKSSLFKSCVHCHWYKFKPCSWWFKTELQYSTSGWKMKYFFMYCRCSAHYLCRKYNLYLYRSKIQTDLSTFCSSWKKAHSIYTITFILEHFCPLHFSVIFAFWEMRII